MILERFHVQRASDGKYYITTFNRSYSGTVTSTIWPEAHESSDDAFEFAKAHGLPLLEGSVVY